MLISIVDYIETSLWSWHHDGRIEGGELIIGGGL